MEQPPNIPVPPASQELLSHPEDTALETAAAFSHLLETGGISAAWQELAPLQPADQAQVLFALPQNLRAQLQAHLGPSALAALLDFLEPEDDLQLVENISSAQIAQVLDLTSPDVGADVLHLLPEDQGAQILQEMRAAPLVQSLLLYPDDTAGGLMTLDFPVVSEDTNPALVLDSLRLLGPAAETIDSVLVVNADNRLVGSVGLVRLALARPTSPIRAIMDSPVPSVPAATDQEECARLMARYNLSRLPVVDDQGRLTGVIPGEDILDVVQEEATEDMFRIAGVGEERVMGPLGRSLRSRTPWLLINLATAFLAALMISLFESTIGPGRGPGRLPPGGRRSGRHRRHPDRNPRCSWHGPRRSAPPTGAQNPRTRVGPGSGPRPGLGSNRGSGCLGLEGQPRLGTGAGPSHAGQHAGGRPSRRWDAPTPTSVGQRTPPSLRQSS